MMILHPYDYIRKIEDLGAMWTLHKDDRTVVCTLFTHLFGWELAIFIDEHLVHSQVCGTQDLVFDTADEWRARWESLGWA